MNCVFSAWGDVLGSVAEGTQAVAGSGARCRAQLGGSGAVAEPQEVWRPDVALWPACRGRRGCVPPTPHRGRPPARRPRLSCTRAALVSQEFACYFYCVNKASWFGTQLEPVVLLGAVTWQAHARPRQHGLCAGTAWTGASGPSSPWEPLRRQELPKPAVDGGPSAGGQGPCDRGGPGQPRSQATLRASPLRRTQRDLPLTTLWGSH